MASRSGTLLEKEVKRLLELSGFKAELNKRINGYEIDVFINYNNQKIAFECKQYERSRLPIRNLIHEWDSKNKELKFGKIILVITGMDINNQDYQLAKKYNIIIWNESKLDNLLDSAIEKKIENKTIVLKELGIKLDTPKPSKKRKTKYKKHRGRIVSKFEKDLSKEKEFLERGLIKDYSEKLEPTQTFVKQNQFSFKWNKNKPSKAWYIFPLIFGWMPLIGLIVGIICYYLLKNRDQKMARSIATSSILFNLFVIFLIMIFR